jgi:hypothetical protein
MLSLLWQQGEASISFLFLANFYHIWKDVFSFFMSGWPRSTLNKASPSKPDKVVQFMLFPKDKCNASI